MKNLSYLQAFSVKDLRTARRILEKGFTAEDISAWLEMESKADVDGKAWIRKPCDGCQGKKK